MFFSSWAGRVSKRARSIFCCVLLALPTSTLTFGLAPAIAQAPSGVASRLPNACPGKNVETVLRYALLQAQTQFANIRGRDLTTQFINLDAMNLPSGDEFDRQYQVIGTGYDFCPDFFTLTHDEFSSVAAGPPTYAMGWSLRYLLQTEDLTEVQTADALVAAYAPLLPDYTLLRQSLPGKTGATATDDIFLSWSKGGDPYTIKVTALVLHCGEQSYFDVAVDCSSRSAANEIAMSVNAF